VRSQIRKVFHVHLSEIRSIYVARQTYFSILVYVMSSKMHRYLMQTELKGRCHAQEKRNPCISDHKRFLLPQEDVIFLPVTRILSVKAAVPAVHTQDDILQNYVRVTR
jgi:hypothetical protein